MLLSCSVFEPTVCTSSEHSTEEHSDGAGQQRLDGGGLRQQQQQQPRQQLRRLVDTKAKVVLGSKHQQSDEERLQNSASKATQKFALDRELLRDASGADAADAVSTTIITIIGSEPPVFASIIAGKEGEDVANSTIVPTPEAMKRRTVSFERVQKQHDYILYEMQRRYPSAKQIASVTKLVNVLYIEISDLEDYNDKPWSLATNSGADDFNSDSSDEDRSNHDDHYADRIKGITSIHPHVSFDLNLNVTIPAMFETTDITATPYCATGSGVRVAVLDTGVDYTHAALGGDGTKEAYESAYGTHPGSRRNRQRNGMFPTRRVYDGKDFLGDRYRGNKDGSEGEAFPDNDPIDGQGHGTFVAAHILAMAPEARVMALKVCATEARRFGCPSFAILQGLEYAVDPNNDRSMRDRVDIVNLSFGEAVSSAYYNELTIAVEAAFAVGVLSVVSIGNAGNKAFVSGGVADSPNVLTVGATGNSRDPGRAGVMERYSSRGPGANSQLKPDLSAPAGNYAAVAGSGTDVRKVFGTSFSAPLVAGAAALLKSKCRGCDPLALKTLLMNSANRFVMASDDGDTRRAPLSWAGAGELRVKDALEADFWVYSNDKKNFQPSMSLGVINAAVDRTIQRRLRVRSLTSVRDQHLDFSVQWRDPLHGSSRAVVIEFNKEDDFMLMGGCQEAGIVVVSFKIDASKAPANFLTTDRDPDALARNEYDGHIIIMSRETGKTISVPFHMILRRASNLLVSPSRFDLDNEGEKDFKVTLQNTGNGVAQVDSYQLLHLDNDEAEPTFGTANAPADMRSVGYRTLKVNKPGCTNMLEFAVNFWERPQHILPTFVTVAIDIGESTDAYLVTRSRDLVVSETYVINTDGDRVCTGFPADHGVDSGNVVLRACTEHIGMAPEGDIRVAILTVALPRPEVSDNTKWVHVSVPNADFFASSQDVQAGQTIEVDVSYKDSNAKSTDLGVQFITNAYRSEESTGAASRDTEIVFFLRNGISLPSEVTQDILDFPDAKRFRGPRCTWRQDMCIPEPSSPNPPVQPPVRLTDFPTKQPEPTNPEQATMDPTSSPSCPPNVVPRASIPVPILAPVAIISGGVFACFDGISTIIVENKGAIQMKDLRIGDKVEVQDGKFESVYSFGHYDPSFKGHFLRITVSATSSITISDQHMVFVESKHFVPASLVRVGDQLLDSSGVAMAVLRIEQVKSRGAFAPFTPSGKLVVGGILASSYIALEESAYLTNFGRTNISFQWLAHMSEFPHRMVCHYFSVCQIEEYTSEGISHWVHSSLRWSLWLFEQGPNVRKTLLASYMIVATMFALIEMLLTNPIILLICTFHVVRIVRSRRQTLSGRRKSFKQI